MDLDFEEFRREKTIDGSGQDRSMKVGNVRQVALSRFLLVG